MAPFMRKPLKNLKLEPPKCLRTVWEMQIRRGEQKCATSKSPSRVVGEALPTVGTWIANIITIMMTNIKSIVIKRIIATCITMLVTSIITTMMTILLTMMITNCYYN